MVVAWAQQLQSSPDYFEIIYHIVKYLFTVIRINITHRWTWASSWTMHVGVAQYLEPCTA